MTDNTEAKTALQPECGPHCGKKDEYLGHCHTCHMAFQHVKEAEFPHAEHYIGGVGLHFCNGEPEICIAYE